MPTVSPGTAPLGPQPSTTTATLPPAGSTLPDGTTRQPGAVTPDTGAIAPSLPTQIGAGVTTTVPTPPPVPSPDTTAPLTANEAGQVWIAGHYSWTGQWTWVDGTWQRPPSANATWMPGRFDATTRRWTEGHWEAGGSSRDVTPQSQK